MSSYGNPNESLGGITRGDLRLLGTTIGRRQQLDDGLRMALAMGNGGYDYRPGDTADSGAQVMGEKYRQEAMARFVAENEARQRSRQQEMDYAQNARITEDKRQEALRRTLRDEAWGRENANKKADREYEETQRKARKAEFDASPEGKQRAERNAEWARGVELKKAQATADAIPEYQYGPGGAMSVDYSPDEQDAISKRGEAIDRRNFLENEKRTEKADKLSRESAEKAEKATAAAADKAEKERLRVEKEAKRVEEKRVARFDRARGRAANVVNSNVANAVLDDESRQKAIDAQTKIEMDAEARLMGEPVEPDAQPAAPTPNVAQQTANKAAAAAAPAAPPPNRAQQVAAAASSAAQPPTGGPGLLERIVAGAKAQATPGQNMQQIPGDVSRALSEANLPDLGFSLADGGMRVGRSIAGALSPSDPLSMAAGLMGAAYDMTLGDYTPKRDRELMGAIRGTTSFEEIKKIEASLKSSGITESQSPGVYARLKEQKDKLDEEYRPKSIAEKMYERDPATGRRKVETGDPIVPSQPYTGAPSPVAGASAISANPETLKTDDLATADEHSIPVTQAEAKKDPTGAVITTIQKLVEQGVPKGVVIQRLSELRKDRKKYEAAGINIDAVVRHFLSAM